jgi:hypothetical protein
MRLWRFFAVTGAVLLLAACQQEEVDTRPALYSRVLACAECGYSGVDADIWESPQLAKVQCRVPWNTVVEVVTEDEPMSEVRTTCTGWVANTLLQPVP